MQTPLVKEPIPLAIKHYQIQAKKKQILKLCSWMRDGAPDINMNFNDGATNARISTDIVNCNRSEPLI